MSLFAIESLPLLIGSGFIAIALLVVGAEWLVNRCTAVAKYLGISPAFIGLTVISIGTSIPEIFTHIVASIKILTGQMDPYVASATVVGTNIGSDIVQQNMIIGVVALLGTVIATKKFLRRDYLVMVGAAALLWFFSIGGIITPIEGTIMLVAYLIYLWFLWIDEKHEHAKHVDHIDHLTKRNLYVDTLAIMLFLAMIVVAAEHILTVSERVVEVFNIGGSLIGVLVVGICTALPEFTTAVVGVIKKNTALSVGTLVGSNITNPLFGLGLGAAISGYYVPSVVIIFDLPVKIGTSLVILYFLWKGRTRGRLGISKWEALVMIGMYLAYVLIRTQYFISDVY